MIEKSSLIKSLNDFNIKKRDNVSIPKDYLDNMSSSIELSRELSRDIRRGFTEELNKYRKDKSNDILKTILDNLTTETKYEINKKIFSKSNTILCNEKTKEFIVDLFGSIKLYIVSSEYLEDGKFIIVKNGSIEFDEDSELTNKYSSVFFTYRSSYRLLENFKAQKYDISRLF